MPNDAKLGFVAGLAAVVAVALVYFPAKPPEPAPAPSVAPAAVVERPPVALPAPDGVDRRGAPAVIVSRARPQ